MRHLLAVSLQVCFGTGWWREPGSQGDRTDSIALLVKLVKPELKLLVLLLGVSAVLAFALGMSAGWAWRVFINRRTSWWWFLWVAVLLAIATVVAGVCLLRLRGFR